MYFLPHPKAKLSHHNQKLSEENKKTWQWVEIGMKVTLFPDGARHTGPLLRTRRINTHRSALLKWQTLLTSWTWERMAIRKS